MRVLVEERLYPEDVDALPMELPPTEVPERVLVLVNPLPPPRS